jgi:hexosaminidase
MKFDVLNEGHQLRCQITSDRDLTAPTFCFSVFVPCVVVAGGHRMKSVGGYTEVTLPDLKTGQPHEIILRHEKGDFRFGNRAWLPLGPYLRTADGPVPLPALPAGVLPGPVPTPVPLPDGVLPLVPQPDHWQPSGGHLTFTTLADFPQARAIDALARRLGLSPLAQANGTPVRRKTDPSMERGAYTLIMATDGLTLSASDDTGVHHALITLLNLRETCGGEIPCGTITDTPRFDWRGQHLDCARHFYSIDTILRLLDLMALLKLNRFHWHFADDEAFRLEVDSYPDLWKRTAFRGEGELIPGLFGGGIRAGGSYSKADVAHVIAHAKALMIEVLPEVEVPAHAFALNQAVPGLRDPADNGAEESVQGYRANTINPSLPATWDFLAKLLPEVAALFPFGLLHLGCDEAPHGTWSGSPKVKALMAEHDLTTPDDVQGWMMAKLADDLSAQGIRTAAWEEAAKGANGGIGTGTLLFSWTGQGPGIEAARHGYDVVMCPAQNIYFDMAHTADPEDWGATWAAILPLENTVNWRVIPNGAEDIAARIKGVEGCFWGEFTTHDSEMEAMLAPRILGLACKAWERAEATDGPRLRALANAYAPVFDKIVWQRNRSA